MRNNLATEIQQQLNDRKFRRLLLAVSGGLDSICLAHYFIANRDVLGVEWLGIAHVNHGLRAGSADLDEKLVRDFATANGIPFFCAHLDGVALKSAEGSLEENARDARYQALSKIADEIARSPVKPGMTSEDTPEMTNGDATETTSEKIAIVTAHHAGDQAETLYMRLRRGTTLEGLKGMKDVSALIYRPFLSVAREELRDYARENNLDWREDESNSDTKFARNKIRHELLPGLEQHDPGATAQLSRIASLANAAYGKILDAAETLFSPALVLTALATPASFETAGNNANTSAGLPEKRIAIDKKTLRKIFEKHANSDLSEMFRLWISSKGFRFPVDFFKHTAEPAGVRIPVRAAYRTRSIAKFGRTVWICEFDTANAAAKFVSCG